MFSKNRYMLHWCCLMLGIAGMVLGFVEAPYFIGLLLPVLAPEVTLAIIVSVAGLFILLGLYPFLLLDRTSFLESGLEGKHIGDEKENIIQWFRNSRFFWNLIFNLPRVVVLCLLEPFAVFSLKMQEVDYQTEVISKILFLGEVLLYVGLSVMITWELALVVGIPIGPFSPVLCIAYSLLQAGLFVLQGSQVLLQDLEEQDDDEPWHKYCFRFYRASFKKHPILFGLDFLLRSMLVALMSSFFLMGLPSLTLLIIALCLFVFSCALSAILKRYESFREEGGIWKEALMGTISSWYSLGWILPLVVSKLPLQIVFFHLNILVMPVA